MFDIVFYELMRNQYGSDIPFSPTYAKALRQHYRQSLHLKKQRGDLQSLIKRRKQELEILTAPFSTPKGVKLKTSIVPNELKQDIEKRRQELADQIALEQALQAGSIRSLHDLIFNRR